MLIFCFPRRCVPTNSTKTTLGDAEEPERGDQAAFERAYGFKHHSDDSEDGDGMSADGPNLYGQKDNCGPLKGFSNDKEDGPEGEGARDNASGDSDDIDPANGDPSVIKDVRIPSRRKPITSSYEVSVEMAAISEVLGALFRSSQEASDRLVDLAVGVGHSLLLHTVTIIRVPYCSTFNNRIRQVDCHGTQQDARGILESYKALPSESHSSAM